MLSRHDHRPDGYRARVTMAGRSLVDRTGALFQDRADADVAVEEYYRTMCTGPPAEAPGTYPFAG